MAGAHAKASSFSRLRYLQWRKTAVSAPLIERRNKRTVCVVSKLAVMGSNASVVEEKQEVEKEVKDKFEEKTPEDRRRYKDRITKLEARERRNIDTIRRLREENDDKRALRLLEREN